MIANAADDAETMDWITEGIWDGLAVKSGQACLSTVSGSKQALLYGCFGFH